MSTADERLRAATIALAEYQNLAQARARLASDVAMEGQRVQQLTAELERERHDVLELTTGVLGFLSSLAMSGELERERREAMAAEVRLREALTSREALRTQLATLDGRLAVRTRTELEAEVSAARATKEQALIEHGGPGGAQLQDLAIRIESIDIELVPLEDAVVAGSMAVAVFAQILALLDRAGAAPEQAAASVNEARGLVGQAQARLTLFQGAVDGLASPDDTTPPFAQAISDEDRRSFVDDWIKRLFGTGDRATRLAEAQEEMNDRLLRINVQLAPVRERRDELAIRRTDLVGLHDRMLEPR